MEIREYAEKIASYISGATVTEIVKNNNVKKVGIVVDMGSKVYPTIYVDEYYKKNISIEEAVIIIQDILIKHSEDEIDDYAKLMDYEYVKPLLKARLVSNKNEQYAGISAKKYGYDDLKIVPVIDCSSVGIEGTIVVKKEMVKKWGKNIRTIVSNALNNIANDYKMQAMYEFVAEVQGLPKELAKVIFPEELEIITNNKKTFGAIGVISAHEMLKKKYKDGYVVLPSSVHEVIVLNKNINNIEELTNMVQTVNAQCVSEEEQLSDHAYEIVS